MKQAERAQKIDELCQELRAELGITGEAHFLKSTTDLLTTVYDRCEKFDVPYKLVKQILFGR